MNGHWTMFRECWWKEKMRCHCHSPGALIYSQNAYVELAKQIEWLWPCISIPTLFISNVEILNDFVDWISIEILKVWRIILNYNLQHSFYTNIDGNCVLPRRSSGINWFVKKYSFFLLSFYFYSVTFRIEKSKDQFVDRIPWCLMVCVFVV